MQILVLRYSGCRLISLIPTTNEKNTPYNGEYINKPCILWYSDKSVIKKVEGGTNLPVEHHPLKWARKETS